MRITPNNSSEKVKKTNETKKVEFAYIAGLWKADRCSTAKGVVGIRNKNLKLIQKFKEFAENNKYKTKSREVNGFSKTEEIYVCNSKLRKRIEEFTRNREKIFNKTSKNTALAFFGGLIDGDGTIDAKRSTFRIYYGYNEKTDADIDKEILNQLFQQEAVVKEYNVPTLCIHKPRKFAKLVLPFVVSEHKRRELTKLSV